MRLHFGELVDADPLAALDERLDAAVGQLEELQDVDHGADAQQVVGLRVVLQRLALAGQDDRRLRLVRQGDGADRALAPHEQGRHHLGEDDQLSRGHERQDGRRRRRLSSSAPPLSGRLFVKFQRRGVRLGDERGVEPLLDRLSGDHALAHVAPRRQVEHDVEQRVLDDAAQAAGARLQGQRLVGDGVQRLLGEDQLDAVQQEELLVLAA